MKQNSESILGTFRPDMITLSLIYFLYIRQNTRSVVINVCCTNNKLITQTIYSK